MSSSEIIWPTQKDESWRYTSLKNFLKTEYRPLVKQSFSDDLKIPKDIENLLSRDESIIVFYNGQLVERLCENLGAIQFMTSHEALKNAELSDDVKSKLVGCTHHSLKPFAALNEKMTETPYLLKLNAAETEYKVHFVYMYGNLYEQKTEPFVSYYKNLVLLEAGVKAEIVESHLALNNIQFHINGASDYLLSAGAQLTHLKQSWLGDYAVGVFEAYFEVKKNARLKSLNSVMSGALVRNEIAAHLIEEGAEAQLDGVYLGREKDHIDNSTLLHHHVGHTKSDQLYKGVLSGHSRAVFNGQLIINQDAQKSNAAQLNQTLLVSDFAEMDTKPALEVYADDVKAAHGASIGRISEEELFYLQSRAIAKDKAFAMLAKGFVNEVLTRLEKPTLAAKASQLLERAMPALLQKEGIH